MRVVCNNPDGLDLHQLRVEPGENLVDDAVWDTVLATINPRWLATLTSRVGCLPAQLELRVDSPAPAPAPARVCDVELTAKEKIALVEAATTYDQLDALERNETRKTVLQAIYKRAEQIDNDEDME